MTFQQVSNTEKENKVFGEQDLEELIRHTLIHKEFSLDKASKRIFIELAHTFLEEVLDLPNSDKNSLNKDALARQISLKFP